MLPLETACSQQPEFKFSIDEHNAVSSPTPSAYGDLCLVLINASIRNYINEHKAQTTK
jgi:hypothetical protein